jgi:hypothetical protein
VRRGADLVAEDRVERGVAVLREAGGAALLAADEVLGAVVPAARALREVAAERRHRAELRRRGVAGGVGDHRVRAAQARVGGELRERDVRADLRAAGPDLDLVEPGELAEADEAARALDALLEPIEQIDAAGERHRAGRAERRHRVGDGLGLDPFEALHDRFPFRSAASTARGVIGSSRMRTPIAL